MTPPAGNDQPNRIQMIYQHGRALMQKAFPLPASRFFRPVKVTVVTPCFNHGRYLAAMLASLWDQTFSNFEVIIVNDGSTDDTAKILNSLTHRKLTVLHTPHYGPAHARNLAIKHSKGSIILNLDADDKIAPTFIEKCVAILDERPNVGIVYSDVELFGAQSGPFMIGDYSLEAMLFANCIVANACFRKADWAKTQGYSEQMDDGYEDFDFWLSIIELGRDVVKIEEPLVYYRTYPSPQESRSGRRKKDPYRVERVRVQAFERHQQLYQKSPRVYQYFSALKEKLGDRRSVT